MKNSNLVVFESLPAHRLKSRVEALYGERRISYVAIFRRLMVIIIGTGIGTINFLIAVLAENAPTIIIIIYSILSLIAFLEVYFTIRYVIRDIKDWIRIQDKPEATERLKRLDKIKINSMVERLRKRRLTFNRETKSFRYEDNGKTIVFNSEDVVKNAVGSFRRADESSKADTWRHVREWDNDNFVCYFIIKDNLLKQRVIDLSWFSNQIYTAFMENRSDYSLPRRKRPIFYEVKSESLYNCLYNGSNWE